MYVSKASIGLILLNRTAGTSLMCLG